MLTVLVPAASQRLTTVEAVADVLGLTTGPQLTQADLLIDAASAAIAARCRRVWGQETVVEELPGSGNVYLGVSRTPVTTAGTVLSGTVTEDGATITDYGVDDAAAGRLYRGTGWAGGVVRGWDAIAYSSGYIKPELAAYRYAVTYQGGYVCPSENGTPAVTLPTDVQRAAVETVRVWYQQRALEPGVVEKTVGDVTVRYGAANAPTPLRLPPLAETLLRPWVRPAFAPGL